MTLLEDIKTGKYNIIFFMVILIFIFHLYWMCTNKIESMANLDDTQKNEVKDLIYSTYKIDVNAIKNLSEIANKLQTAGVTLPGNLIMKGAVLADNDIAHPDISNGAVYSADGKMTIASKDLIRFRSSTNKSNTIEMNVKDGNLNLNALNANTINAANGINTNTINVNGKIKESGNELIPKGVIVAWTGTTPPGGWALCDGANGTPDLRGRFILSMGQGAGLTNRTINSKDGGEESVRLTIEHMPSHNHGIPNIYAASQQDRGAGHFNWWKMDGYARALSPYSTGTTGGDKPHNNMPPFYVLAYIMKL
jgi:microcystin-dependent protein